MFYNPYSLEAVADLSNREFILNPTYHYYPHPLILNDGCTYPLIYDMDNLLDAYFDCFVNTNKSLEMLEYTRNFSYAITQTQKELITKTFSPDNPFMFKEYDPKERIIFAPRFHTRVVQKALIQVVGPYLDYFAVPYAAANVPGRGTSFALEKVKSILANSNIIVRCDVHHYFQSIDPIILRCILFDLVKCPDTNWLLNECIPNVPIGIPIGSITSQYFANLYLDPLDKLICNQLGISNYCRYMDDFMIGVNSYSEAIYVFNLIKDFLYYVLHLQLNPNSSIINADAQFDFVGFRYVNRKTYMTDRRLNSLLEDIDKFASNEYCTVESYFLYLRPAIMNFISVANRYTEDQYYIDIIINKLKSIGIDNFAIKPNKLTKSNIRKELGFHDKKSFGFFSREIAKQKRAEKQSKNS